MIVNNKFALFDSEDEDPLEVLQRSQDAATQQKAAKENAAKTKVAAKNAKNASKSAKTESKQPAKVLTLAQDQKAKTSTQNAPPRRDNTTGWCTLLLTAKLLNNQSSQNIGCFS